MFALNSHYYYFYYSAVKIAAAARKQAVASEAKGALYRHSCNRSRGLSITTFARTTSTAATVEEMILHFHYATPVSR